MIHKYLVSYIVVISLLGFCLTNFVDEIYYKTHHFVVVNQFVDPAELEDHQSSENLHRCL